MRHEKAEGLLELARLLGSTAEGLTLDEMATAAGVGRRTAERMRDALEALFPQMEVLADGAIKRFRIVGGLDAFFQMPTTEELVELARATASLRSQGRAGQSNILASLDRKIRTAMKGSVLRKLNPDVEVLSRAEFSAARAGPRPVDDPKVLSTIRQALMSMHGLKFRYRGGSRPGRVRSVVPFGLLHERMNYLVAAEMGSEEPRNWRLDRIEQIELLEDVCSPPPTFDLEAYAQRSFGIYQDELEKVQLRIFPHGVEEARSWRFHASQAFKEEPDGYATVTFNSAGMTELAWHLFTWGNKVEIIAPERLKVAMRDAILSAASRCDLSLTTDSDESPRKSKSR